MATFYFERKFHNLKYFKIEILFHMHRIHGIQLKIEGIIIKFLWEKSDFM